MARVPSINQIIISGNIVQDAVVKHVGAGNIAVTTIRIANNQSFLNKEKEWQDKTTFVDVEIWGSRAEKGEKYYKKGIPLIIEGDLKERKECNNCKGDRIIFLVMLKMVYDTACL